MDENTSQMACRGSAENVELRAELFARKILFARGEPKHFFLIKIGEDFYWDETVCTKISYSRFSEVGVNNVHKIFDLNVLFQQKFYEAKCLVYAVE